MTPAERADECIRIRDGKAGGMAHPDTSTEYHKITQQATKLREGECRKPSKY